MNQRSFEKFAKAVWPIGLAVIVFGFGLALWFGRPM
jgi:hypothetical protein